MNIILLALVTYLVIITIGHVVNKYARLPWMFTTVILGMLLSASGLFANTLASQEMALLSRLGMLLFLLTIGMDLDLKQIRHLGRHIVGVNLLMVFTEGLLLASFFYVFLPEFVSHSFLVALLAGISFGTVGEVVLLAILKEFKLEGTRFGQLALGIGVFDDIFEILVLAAVVAMPVVMQGDTGAGWQTSASILLTLVVLGVAALLASKMGPYTRAWLQKLKADSFVVPFFIFAVVFAFIYGGTLSFENLGVVAAIFGGMAVKELLPQGLFQQYKKPIFFVANVFLGPFFFLSLGSKMSLGAVLSYPHLILVVVLIALGSRITISYLVFRRILGKRQALTLGVGLTSKFSTSVITENLLFSAGLITAPLYSILMGSFIVLKPLIVGGFARGTALIAERELGVRTVEPELPKPTPVGTPEVA